MKKLSVLFLLMVSMVLYAGANMSCESAYHPPGDEVSYVVGVENPTFYNVENPAEHIAFERYQFVCDVYMEAPKSNAEKIEMLADLEVSYTRKTLMATSLNNSSLKNFNYKNLSNQRDYTQTGYSIWYR